MQSIDSARAALVYYISKRRKREKRRKNMQPVDSAKGVLFLL